MVTYNEIIHGVDGGMGSNSYLTLLQLREKRGKEEGMKGGEVPSVIFLY